LTNIGQFRIEGEFGFFQIQIVLLRREGVEREEKEKQRG
jgi:hypothetical protein